MPAWLLPAVKLILPHVGTLVAAATPHFTKRKEATDLATMQKQIAELQAAATENAALVKDLAEQLQLTVTALEQTATNTQDRVRRLYAISIIATLTALAALLVAAIALLGP